MFGHLYMQFLLKPSISNYWSYFRAIVLWISKFLQLRKLLDENARQINTNNFFEKILVQQSDSTCISPFTKFDHCNTSGSAGKGTGKMYWKQEKWPETRRVENVRKNEELDEIKDESFFQATLEVLLSSHTS